MNQKALGLIKATKDNGNDYHNLIWALKTGRLNTETEWEIMEFTGSRTLGDAIYYLSTTKNDFQYLIDTAETEELIEKGYIEEYEKAQEIVNRSDIQKWTNY